MNYISFLKVISYLVLFLNWSSLVKAQDVCSFIKKVQNYQDSVRILFFNDSCEIDTQSFQLESYLSMFDKLNKAPERKFEIYYQCAILSGEPIIYTTPKNFDIEEYIQDKIRKSPAPKYRINTDLSPQEMRDLIFFYFVNDSARRALNYLSPEDSKMGYFQYLLFYTIGEQFALISHSLDFQKRILCTTNDKDYIRSTYGGNEGLFIEEEELKKLDAINFTPIIRSTQSDYYICWYELETHRGIFRREYKLNRTSPYKIKEISSIELININRTFNY